MMSEMQYNSFKSKFKNIYTPWMSQKKILEDGLSEYAQIIFYILPIILTISIMIFSYIVDLSIKKTLQNIIAIMPSLIGFLIASATIMISINNETLNTRPSKINYTYKQIGGAIFFNATKTAFILLVIAFLCPDVFPKAFLWAKDYVIPLVQISIYWMFSKFVIMVLYGLMYLTASIEVEKTL